MKIIRWLIIALLPVMAHAVPVAPASLPHITFVDGAGLPCSTCSLYTYAAGTSTPLATYTDSTGTSQNTNPIILDAAGGTSIWVGSASYKFILKNALGTVIWTSDNVNAGNLFPCSSAAAIQVANPSGAGLACDPTITINTTTHVINVGTLGAHYVTIAPLGTPTTWTLDTTTPASALASMGGGTVAAGTANQLAYYPAGGSAIAGTTNIPSTITVATQPPSSNSLNLANTAYVAAPGAISPVSLQVASGTAVTDNQGSGAKMQHSAGAVVTNNCAKFDASGNTVDAGFTCVAPTPRTCTLSGCYRISSDGTIEQWGNVNGCAGGACSINVTFPISFTTTANLVVQTTCFDPGQGNCMASVIAKSVTGITFTYGPMVFVGGSGPSLSGLQTGDWYAIGN